MIYKKLKYKVNRIYFIKHILFKRFLFYIFIFIDIMIMITYLFFIFYDYVNIYNYNEKKYLFD